MDITLKYIKPLLYWLPEMYLLLATAFYWVLTGLWFNPVALFLMGLLVIQMLYNPRSLGLFIASIFILLNVYLIAAMVSDLMDIAVFGYSAQQLLVFGLAFMGINLLMAFRLLFKHLPVAIQPTSFNGIK
ncbi:hypothetical protein MG296_07715 [Flavobacteriaceae bacterium TK19130]|nr:hypothetical protein [Thermobacterium salinum]